LLLIAACALVGIYRLARVLTNRQVAVAATICAACYPVFFIESAQAHEYLAVTALVAWGLSFYLQAAPEELAADASSIADGTRRFIACLLFSLAVLVKASALVTPLALFAWEIFCRRRSGKSAAAPSERGGGASVFMLLLALCALALRLAYEFHQTGQLPHVELVAVGPLLRNCARRIWQVTGHLNLWLLTLAGVLAMTRRALFDEGAERPRIAIPAQVAFAFIIAAQVLALSFTRSAGEAREMLPVIPPVMLIWVSTLYRRVRVWRWLVGMICAGFLLAWLLARS
jgi:hypothetical protein